MPKYQDIAGMKFGAWTAISRVPTKNQLSKWACICVCGVSRDVSLTSLNRGLSKSCGCLKVQDLVQRLTTHGKTKVPGFKSWCAMVDRCTNPKNASYHHYGAKGISVAPEWSTFDGFFADMGERPAGMSIERDDNSKGYFKENCRWATTQEQAMNKSTAVVLTYDGITLSQREWSKKLGITDSALAKRLKKWGSIEKSLTTPAKCV